jgi:hypothetical protein
MPLLLALPAAGAVDIDQVILEVRIVRSSLVSDEFSAELRVTGDNLNTGTITLPAAPGIQLALTKDGDDLVLEDDFATELDLNTAISDGSYVLRVNNDSVRATLTYVRPLVPSPAISYPDAGDVVPPGTIDVEFTNCAVCNQVGDSVEAELEDDVGAPLADETLTSTSEDWIPPDGIGGDYDLPEDSDFVVRVTHSALRQDNFIPNPPDDDGLLLFSNRFVQSDEVDFSTGFDAPIGDFCLSANHPAPPAGCTVLTDPALQLIDLTGSYTTWVDGHDVDYSVDVSASGSLSGSASADLDDNLSNETGPAPIKGKLSGSDGDSRSKLSFSLQGDAPPAKVKVSMSDEFSILGNTSSMLQKASGSINGIKFKEETSASGPLGFPPLGWVIEFELDAGGEVQNAMLTLEGGRMFALTGSNKFKFASDESSFKLQSDPKGIKIQLKKLILDDSVDPMDVTAGDLSSSMLGQRARTSLP